MNRQTTVLNYEITTMWETKRKTIPQKTSQMLMGPEEVMRPEALQAI
jgi:hypothetical protein